MPPPASPPPGLPRVIAGRYEVERVLGRGGMGDVLLARDRRLDRHVALKQIRAGLPTDREFMDRLGREARALARVRHPGVIQVHDLLEPGGGDPPYLVLEYVPGRSLAEHLAEQGRLPWDRCAAIGAEAADALHAAHLANVIHRDVKPGNILLEADGTVRVADFGIARLTDASATRSGLVLGTPAYMAPEIGAGRRASAATDVYGLTAVLFEAACGRPPFVPEDPNAAAVIMMHMVAPVPDPWGMAPHLPAAAREILMRGLQKDPADRFPSAAAMAGALRDARSPVTAPGPAADPVVVPSARTERVADPASTTRVDTVRGPAPAPPPPPVAPAPVTVGSATTGTRRAPGPPRRRGPRPVPVAFTLAGLAAAAALAGALAGGAGGDAEATSDIVVPLRELAAPAASLRRPDDWVVADAPPAEARALGLTGVRTLRAPGDGAAGLSLGTTRATDPTLLPAAVRALLPGDPPAPGRVRLGSVEAVVFPGLQTDAAPGRRMDVYVVPTTRGTVTIACHGPAETFTDHGPACGRIAATLRLAAGVRAHPPGPDPAYGRFLGRALSRMSDDRDRALAALAAAGTRTAQADAAGRAAGAHAALRNALAGRRAPTRAAAAHSGLRAAAARAAAAYAALRRAARAGDPDAWVRARRRALAADRAVSARARAMGAAGYPARGG